MRKQMVKTIHEIMKEDDRVVVLLGDVGVYGFKPIFDEFPDRIWNLGIMEQSMVSIAAGMAMGGKIPFVTTIASFLVLRALEQLKIDFVVQGLNGNFIGIDGFPKLGETHNCAEWVDVLDGIGLVYSYNYCTDIPDNAEELFDTSLRKNYAKDYPCYWSIRADR